MYNTPSCYGVKHIYGCRTTSSTGSGSGSGSGPCPAPLCDPIEQTNLLLSLLDSIYSTVDRLFPLIIIGGKNIADATAATYVPPRKFARLYWAQEHKGVKFGGDRDGSGNLVNPIILQIHLLQLKDIYLMIDEDMSVEPLFRLLTVDPADPVPPA